MLLPKLPACRIAAAAARLNRVLLQLHSLLLQKPLLLRLPPTYRRQQRCQEIKGSTCYCCIMQLALLLRLLQLAQHARLCCLCCPSPQVDQRGQQAYAGAGLQR